jgi:hypothetical protein
MAGASLTVSFVNATSNADVVVELDAERNAGKTQFAFGTKAYFKVFADPSLNLNIDNSDGTVTPEGLGTDLITEELTAVDAQTQNTAKVMVSVADSEWYGNSMGAVTKTAAKTVVFEKLPAPGSANGVAIGQVKYYATFRRYAVQVPDKGVPTYNVLVVVY